MPPVARGSWARLCHTVTLRPLKLRLQPGPPCAAAGTLEVAASGSLAGVAFFGALLSCVSRLKTVVSRAFFLLFHGSHTMALYGSPCAASFLTAPLLTEH